MLIVLSGEGKSDLGYTAYNGDFIKGPMGYAIEYFFPKAGQHPQYHYISETELTKICKGNKRLHLGERGATEKPYKGIYNLAMHLSSYASNKFKEKHCVVLFRDADGTNSVPRDNWEQKVNAVLAGFDTVNKANGVPMIPRPKSEAWLLAYYQENLPNQKAYNKSGRFEDYSGNDASKNSLKKLLQKAFKGVKNPYDQINGQEIDWDRIDMPSFNRFKERLKEVIRYLLSP